MITLAVLTGLTLVIVSVSVGVGVGIGQGNKPEPVQPLRTSHLFRGEPCSNDTSWAVPENCSANLYSCLFPAAAARGFCEQPCFVYPGQVIDFFLASYEQSTVATVRGVDIPQVILRNGTVIEQVYVSSELCTNHPWQACSTERGCAWSKTVSFRVPRWAPSGKYELSYTGSDYPVIFTVGCAPGPGRSSKVVQIFDVLTGASFYNMYGGISHYGTLRSEPFNKNHRNTSLRLPVAMLREYIQDPDSRMTADSRPIPDESDPFVNLAWRGETGLPPEQLCWAPLEAAPFDALTGFRVAVMVAKNEYVTADSVRHLRKWIEGGGRLLMESYEFGFQTLDYRTDGPDGPYIYFGSEHPEPGTESWDAWGQQEAFSTGTSWLNWLPYWQTGGLYDPDEGPYLVGPASNSSTLMQDHHLRFWPTLGLGYTFAARFERQMVDGEERLCPVIPEVPCANVTLFAVSEEITVRSTGFPDPTPVRLFMAMLKLGHGELHLYNGFYTGAIDLPGWTAEQLARS